MIVDDVMKAYCIGGVAVLAEPAPEPKPKTLTEAGEQWRAIAAADMASRLAASKPAELRPE